MTPATARYPTPFPIELSTADVALAWSNAEATLAYWRSHPGRHHFAPAAVGLDELEVRANAYASQIVVARATGRIPLLHSEVAADRARGDLSGGIEVRYSFPKRGEVLRIRPNEDRGKLYRPFVLVLSRHPLPPAGPWSATIAGWEFGTFPLAANLELHPRDERGPAFYAISWILLRPIADLLAYGPEHDFDVPPEPTTDDWRRLAQAFGASRDRCEESEA